MSHDPSAHRQRSGGDKPRPYGRIIAEPVDQTRGGTRQNLCVKVLGLGSALALLLPTTAVAQGAGQSTVGAEQCKTCHEFEYQVWAQSQHKRAQEALSPEQQRDAKCATCHTGAQSDAAATATATTGVDCERCHGPGKYYHPRYVMKDRELARAVGLIDLKPTHCAQCHTEGAPSIRPFEYATEWAKIDHGRAARAAHAKTEPQAAPSAKPSGTAPSAKPSGTAPSAKPSGTAPSAKPSGTAAGAKPSGTAAGGTTSSTPTAAPSATTKPATGTAPASTKNSGKPAPKPASGKPAPKTTP